VNDLTEAFRTYRECLRVVWNAFLRLYPDGEHWLGPADSALFDGMLLSQMEHFEKPRRINGREYYERLRIVAATDAPMDILYSVDAPDTVSWHRGSWAADQASLCYSDLFDFDTLSGTFREFRYVRTIVLRSSRPPFKRGQRVLLDADMVRIIETQRPPESPN
jgi:hypothetical protein